MDGFAGYDKLILATAFSQCRKNLKIERMKTMIQIRKKENPKQLKEKKPRVYKANTHKRIVIALWTL